jgi:hypothetical protein
MHRQEDYVVVLTEWFCSKRKESVLYPAHCCTRRCFNVVKELRAKYRASELVAKQTVSEAADKIRLTTDRPPGTTDVALANQLAAAMGAAQWHQNPAAGESDRHCRLPNESRPTDNISGA